MRLLIVNGYGKNLEGYKKFSEFQYIIMKICAEQKELMDTETECFIRDKDNIDDFLYEIDSGFVKKEGATNFDALDIVFITGDANIRPWSLSMKKIITLLRMCLRVKKNLFACGFGAQALVYLCASNMEKNIQIINGDGSGGKLTDIGNLSNFKQYKQSDFFLDNTTGDIYGFNYEQSEWVPRGNVGLHYRRAAEEFQSIGKYIVQAPVYKPNLEHAEKYKFFKQRQYEETCSLKKMFLQHWAFEGMDSEFIVPLKNTWDIHSFTFINPEKTLHVIAESIRGPLIFYLKNMLCTLFPTNSKYPNTLIPIKNFILHTLKQVKSQSTTYQNSIQHVQSSKFDNKHDDLIRSKKQTEKKKTLQLMNQRAQSLGFSQTSNDEFRHVGMSAKKEHMKDFYNENNIGANKIKQLQIKNHSIFQPKVVKMQSQLSNIWGGGGSNDEMAPNSSQLTNTNRLNEKGQIKVQRNNFKTDKTKDDKEQLFTQGGVRQQLHPYLQKEYINFKRMWIPGQLTSSISQNSIQKVNLKTLSQTLTSHKSYHKQNDIQLTGVVPCTTKYGKMFSSQMGSNSFLFSGEPYIHQEKIQKLMQLQEDKKIIGPPSFKYKSTELKKEDSPFQSDPTPVSVHNHVYREFNKEKWVANQFLLL